MWCPNCGREIADDAAFCGYCGRKIQYDGNTNSNEGERNFGQESPAEDYTESRENNDPRGERIDSGRYKRAVIIAVTAAVVLAAALVTCVFLLPGGSSPNEDPSSAYAEDPGDSEDTGSDDEQGVGYERDESLIKEDAGSLMLLDLSEMELTAADSEEALEVLESLNGILNIDDAQEELTLKNENSFGGSSYYRFQQMYEGLTVYGKAVVLAVDEDGGVELLSGNLADMTGAVTEPVIDEEAAIAAAQAYLEEAGSEDATGTDNSDSADESAAEYSAELCYYLAEETDTPVLSWAVEIGFDTVFVDAVYGIVLGEVSASSNLTGYSGDGSVEVPVMESNGLYYLTDEERYIYIATLDGASSDKRAYKQFLTSDNLYFGDTQEEQELEYDKGIELLSVLQPIYDYYDDNYGETGFGTVFAVYNDGKDNGRNASGGVMGDDDGYLSVGEKMPLDLTDEIGHEYTHIIRSYHIGEATSFESMALSEAFSDIMGILIDASVHGESPDWLVEVEEADVYRDARTPSISNYSELDSLTIIDAGSIKRYPEDAKYDACTLITHTAYLMWEGEESAEIEAIDDADLLTELWYRTMLLLQSDSSFVDCRTACEASASQMYRLGLLSEQQVSAVIWAFDQVGIYSSASIAAIDSLLIRIYDAGGAETDQYILTVSDSSGELVETVNGPTVGSSVDLDLAQGVYSIVVTSTEADYTEEKTVVTVLSQYDIENVFTWTTTSELDICTTFGTALAGKVTDEDGNALEDVQITVEPAQIGQTEAEQIAEESAVGGNVYSAGQILSLAQQTSTATTLTTDASGNYSVKLPVGIYQLTFEQDGYKTTTVRQVVFSGDNTVDTVAMETEGDETAVYQLYYDKLMEMQETYGEALLCSEDSAYYIGYTSYWWKGLFYAELIDFDSDGQEELVTAARPYERSGSNTSEEYVVQVWTVTGGSVEEIYSSNSFIFYENGSGCVIEEVGGIWYMVDGFWSGSGELREYYQYSDGSFDLAKSFDIYGTSSGCYVDGTEVSNEDWNKAWDEWENQLIQRKTIYFTWADFYEEMDGWSTEEVLENTLLRLREILGISDSQDAISSEAVASGTCGENLTWVLDSEGTLTISGTGDMEDYEESTGAPWFSWWKSIRRTVMEYGVTHIGSNAFFGCLNQSEIVIPGSVVSIGDYAFYNNNDLMEVTIPDSVTEIGDSAFAACTGLKELNLSDNLHSIGDAAFSSSELISVVIPAGVERIGENVFYLCVYLEDIYFEGNAPAFAEGAFTEVTASAWYPADNDTWTSEILQDYGGDITWQAY